MSRVITLFVCSLAAANGALRGKQSGTIESLDLSKALSDMQPEVVAKLLSQVETRWKESRVAALRNQTDEHEALAEMTKSCMKVAKAVIDGSEGDKDRVVEYMVDVCDKGTNKKGCDSFAAGIENTMTHDVEVNRDSLDLSKFCLSYWQTTVTVDAKAEAQRLNEEEATQKKEEAERAEAERKAQETQAAEKKEADAENKESEDMAEAEKLQKATSEEDAEVSKNTKAVEERIAQAQDKATELVDKARSALQLAAEKEVQAEEKPQSPWLRSQRQRQSRPLRLLHLQMTRQRMRRQQRLLAMQLPRRSPTRPWQRLHPLQCLTHPRRQRQSRPLRLLRRWRLPRSSEPAPWIMALSKLM